MPDAIRASPPVNCGRYSSNRSAENWSTEMTTSSLGGAAAAARPTAIARQSRRGGKDELTHDATLLVTPAKAGVCLLLQQRKAGPGFRSGMTDNSAQFRPQPLVDDLRVGLAGHRLHRLADEEAEQRLLARFILATLSALAARILSIAASIAPVSLVCLSPRLSTIAPAPSPLSSMISNTCLAMVPLIVPSATRPSSSAACAGVTGLLSIALAAPVERAEQLGDDPVRGLLGLGARLEQSIEPARGLDFGGQHARIVGRDAERFVALALGVGQLGQRALHSSRNASSSSSGSRSGSGK